MKERLKNTAEIISLLIDSEKGKEWLFLQIKRQGLKIPITRAMSTLEILNACPDGFISLILRALKNDDFDPFIDIKILPKTYHWFYTDIVGSSDPTILTKDQARKVWVLNDLIGRTDTFKQRNPKYDVMSITGDGFIIGFADSPQKPLRLAIELNKIIYRYNQIRKGKNKLSIRVGIDTGPVYFIKDLTGKDNFWGPGIIMTRRIMDLARPNQILASERIANALGKLSPENRSIIHDAGLYKIKHDEKLRIFNIYGKDWGNKHEPSNQLIDENKELRPIPPKILFPKVEVRLDVINRKTMMTRHTWIWNGINIGEKPIDQVSYYLTGDVPRKFANLNVTVTDEKNKKLKIVGVDVNKSREKQFVVKLRKPLKPMQKRRLLKLKYDWEEPERKFVYTLSSNCKKFRYLFTAPKNLEVKPRILQVDIGTRLKSHASPPPQTKYLKDKTVVTWEGSNLLTNDTFQFEW